MAGAEATQSRIDLNGISKAFPGVLANDKVSFSVMPGEIHALLGENGAGKSTLVKMIYGVMQPDEGRIGWNGSPVTIASPREATPVGHRHGVPALLTVRSAYRSGKHRAGHGRLRCHLETRGPHPPGARPVRPET
jgi:ABC-type multidrug transport system ATPase subunit